MTFTSKQFIKRFYESLHYYLTRYRNPTLALLLLLSTLASTAFGQIKTFEIGNYPLENGQEIQSCTIAYQTFGHLNSDRSNAILFPSWYGGTSDDLTSYIGEHQMLDSTKYFIILVDAFGNGISSSPSTSLLQPGIDFPEFSIDDLVKAQHKLLTEHFKINHLVAVTGISMGGMQTFQWIASYPDFFDLAIPIVGSPKLSSYEKLIFETFERLLTLAESSSKEEVCAVSLMLEYALGFTPEFRAHNTFIEDFPEFINAVEYQANMYSPYDLLSQMRAISAFNMTKTTSLVSVAENFHGEALIICATEDNLLLPNTSKDFAKLIGAQLLELSSDCGHYSFACDKDQISESVRNFLNQPNQ